MKNQGISLISLIITIIVIIILAAIVIFTGLGTPDSANFANFCQEVDNVNSKILNAYSDLKVNHSINNRTRTDEQIYIQIAKGVDNAGVTQYTAMSGLDVKEPTGSGELQTTDTYCQHIDSPDNNRYLGKLPEIRQTNDAWYITSDGRAFNATGYLYESDGVEYTYFTANARTAKRLNAQVGDTEEARAIVIATTMVSGDSLEIPTTIAE